MHVKHSLIALDKQVSQLFIHCSHTRVNLLKNKPGLQKAKHLFWKRKLEGEQEIQLLSEGPVQVKHVLSQYEHK